MEKRKLLSIKNRLRISALIGLFSINAHAVELISYGVDAGLNGSLLLTNADDKQFGTGSGYQLSFFADLDIGRDFLGKIQLDTITMSQALFNETQIASDTNLVEVEQRFYLILAGIEKRYETWFWEAFSGLSMGRESAVTTTDTTNDSLAAYTEKTRSFLLIGGAIGYRMPYKGMHIIARAKTFSLLSNIYSEDLGDEDFYFVLPLMMNVGVEF